VSESPSTSVPERVTVFAVFLFVDCALTLARTGASLTAFTVSVNVFAVESTTPSFALIVMTEVPFQFASGVSVSVVPETLGVTSDSAELAE